MTTQPERSDGARRDAARLLGAVALMIAWFLLLLFGHPLGPAVHLLLAAALLAVPWRLVRR